MPTVDPYKDRQSSLSDVASIHFAISPSNSADLAVRPRALYCAVAGNVVVRDQSGTDITYPMTAGQILPFRANRILATGTTATVIGWT